KETEPGAIVVEMAAAEGGADRCHVALAENDTGEAGAGNIGLFQSELSALHHADRILCRGRETGFADSGVRFISGDKKGQRSGNHLSLLLAVADEVALRHVNGAAVNRRDSLAIGFELVIRQRGKATIPDRDEAENPAVGSRRVVFEKALRDGEGRLARGEEAGGVAVETAVVGRDDSIIAVKRDDATASL